ncbi:MAG: UDP-N-acetylmuramoyl-L-alanine--D-glutamate ligase [Gammaproteobacteria bacterium]|nr:UDP-N-acetylmuramoyl-L-alanine--D-glutamate ligase [Gammaproteobacteria bacterium]
MKDRNDTAPQALHRAVSVVVGLGKTGVSCVRHLAAHGHELRVTDSRANPPGLAELAVIAPGARVATGGFDVALLDGADQVVVSPGVSLREPLLQEAVRRGLDVVGDVELFAREVSGRVVAITGTNGKSTVTTLVGEMARVAGLETRVGGNLGEPALDLLRGAAAELYVLELSSYQLETTRSLATEAAVVLNLTPDHMDRYSDMAEYGAAKARIYERCATAVVNIDDEFVRVMPRPGQRSVTMSLVDASADYRLEAGEGGPWLVACGEPVMPLSAVAMPGLHNASNALAALALGDACGLPRSAMREVLGQFTGLPHRTQLVAERRGVRWIDDSKGTNVGATLAAVAGLSGPLVVIAGGDGKGQDFSPLAPAFSGKVRHCVLIGRDAAAVGAALAGTCSVEYAATLEDAVAAADRASVAGDTVLLSPACASLDMFRDYAHRGQVFAAAAQGLPA